MKNIQLSLLCSAFDPCISPTKLNVKRYFVVLSTGMPKQKADLSELFGAQGPGTLPQGAAAGKSESKSPGRIYLQVLNIRAKVERVRE